MAGVPCRPVRASGITGRQVVFTDAARIELPWQPGGKVRATENMYIQGPEDYDYFTAPGTHFRHSGKITCVSFLDGHVETWRLANVPAPSYWPQEAKDLMDRLVIGYLSEKSVDLYRPY